MKMQRSWRKEIFIKWNKKGEKMILKEIIVEIIVSIVSGFVSGILGATIIIDKKYQKQINKENSTGIQIGEIRNETKK